MNYSLIKTPLGHHAKIKFKKTPIVYFIIMCGAKMVCILAVSSVVREYHEYIIIIKMFKVFQMIDYNFLMKENWVIQETHRL